MVYYVCRLADHLESCNTFSLKRIKFLVLDEADRLLGGRFDKQIATIFNALPKERQTLLFSATMTDTLEKVKKVTKKNVSLLNIFSYYNMFNVFCFLILLKINYFVY